MVETNEEEGEEAVKEFATAMETPKESNNKRERKMSKVKRKSASLVKERNIKESEDKK